MGTEDGQLFIKHLAYYIRTHEKALANSLQPQRPAARGQNAKPGASQAARPPLTTAQSATSIKPTSSTSSGFASTWSMPLFGISSQPTKPAKLYLTPNQLYYLLCRFEELGVSVGPMNVRLENIHSESSHSNYVSFLTKVPKPAGRSSDQDSIHSVSSVRSVMSNMSSMWSSLSLSNNSAAKQEKRKAAEMEDLRYLYSAFTKIPYLKFAQDHRVRRITSYEEFPFDTAVPVFAFKNVSVLEVVDVDFRSFFGWERLADQLVSLTLKRACLDDPTDLLTHIVLDDMDKRRKRSCKAPTSPIQSHSVQTSSTKQSEMARYFSTSDSPIGDERKGMSESPQTLESPAPGLAPTRSQPRVRSKSPGRPPGSSRKGSGSYWRRPRQSSESSGSSVVLHTPRNSSSNLLALNILPANKWRFLRHLSLADNGLASISAESLSPIAQTLQSLDLAANLFTEIPAGLASLVSLRALNLSNCMITSLRSLAKHPLPAITVLNLRANRIESLAGIEKLVSLERLDLRENKLRDPTEIARLTSMPEFRDVYVIRNPFTRTHTAHRVTIFNLFRQTPGYTEDITIDASGPGYSERRQLVDRTPEPMNVPVVPPPVEEDMDVRESPGNQSPILTSSQPESSARLSESAEPTVAAPTASGEDEVLKPFKKRKPGRRRVVDISEAGSPGSRTSLDSPDLAFVTAVQTPARNDGTPTRRQVSKTELSTSRDLNKVLNSPKAQPVDLTQERQSITSDDSEATAVTECFDLSQSSEMYKRKIEALKREHGSNWLNVIGEESRDTATALGYQEKDISATSVTDTNTRGATTLSATVSSGRRIG